MCTNPIQRTITYRGNFSKKTIVVPCGKCAECRAKKQSEFAALSVLEAESAGSIGFITLTYDNCNLPFMISNVYKGEVSQVGFGDYSEPSVEPCQPSLIIEADSVGVYATPSLRREDVQKFIKRYRQDYFRRKGVRLDFRFSFFGEYGERFKRPHYHMLVYGLEKSECQRFCSLWRYGFSDLKFVEHFNSDGSDAFSKVSRYVSKYISKGDFLPYFVRAGYAEKPRRQSSIHFGQRDLDLDSLRNFYLARDFGDSFDDSRLEQIIERKKRFLVAGQQYSMPRQIKEQIYYERKTILHGNWVYRVLCKLPRIKDGLRLRSCSSCALRPLPLYRASLDFERIRNNFDFDRALWRNTKGKSFEDSYKTFRAVCLREEIIRKNRCENATDNYKQQLKKQKYG